MEKNYVLSAIFFSELMLTLIQGCKNMEGNILPIFLIFT